MTPDILVSNLLLCQQLERLAERLPETPLLLLKGAALIVSGYRRLDERPMEDFDLLIRPRDRARVVATLTELGFRKRAEDPGQFVKDGVAFDLHDEIWYLDEAEHELLWARARGASVGGARVLVPDSRDLAIHVLAHAAVHHAWPEPKWADDVRALFSARDEALDRGEIARELRRLGLRPAEEWLARGGGAGPRLVEVPFRGHLARLWFVRGWRFRARLLARAMFPPPEFVRARYDLKAAWQVPVWRALRPVDLGLKLARAALGLRLRRRREYGIDKTDG